MTQQSRLADRINLEAFSPDRLQSVAKQSHIALLKTGIRPNENLKSANRVITAINLGLVAVAEPITANLQLSRFCVLSPSFPTEIRTILNSDDIRLQRIDAGQHFLSHHYSIARIASAWSKFLLIRRTTG